MTLGDQSKGKAFQRVRAGFLTKPGKEVGESKKTSKGTGNHCRKTNRPQRIRHEKKKGRVGQTNEGGGQRV